MPVGNVTELIATTLPLNTSDGKVSWTSSNEEIATVDNNGKVTAHKAGFCTITCITNDRHYKETCKIIVTQPVSSIELDYKEYTFNGIGKTLQLNANILPSNATNKEIVWTSSDNSVCIVSNGLVVSLAKGISTITATTVDGGHVATCLVTVLQPAESISLDVSQYILQLQKGHTKALTATVLPNDADSKDIIWSTEDKGIAKVSQEGIVTGVNTGETYLFAVLKDNPILKDSCLIKVFQPVNSISLNLTEKEIKVGENFKLTANVSPDDADNKNILWKSENDLIAMVENGNVIGKKAGKINITATSEFDNTISATCSVTVIQPVEGISFDKTSMILNNIGESMQLLATIIPDDASNKSVNWKSSDEKVCIVSNGKVVAVGYGTAVVIATTVDGEFMATCSVTVEKTTGIEDLQENKSARYSIFTVDGKHIESLQKGINLIRFDNGQTKKVTVK